ncbi:response regulator [Hydrogenispora ethanolica]|nr:response regulator [Hydrogenispora ethanolica]
MLKVLIVDDDEVIRLGIAKNIRWEEHGFQVAATAENGLEGLELAKTHKPHIVLTDIRMPFMDGLEMSERIHEGLPRAKVIFLTAYDDFEYARKALHLKANGYILKYAANQEILDAVIKARAELIEERNWRERSDRANLLLRRQFLNDLLRGKVAEAQLAEEANLFNISFPGRQFCVAALAVAEPENGAAGKDQRDPELSFQSIYNVCGEFIAEEGRVIALVEARPYLQLIFNCKESDAESNDRIVDALEEIQQRLKNRLKMTLDIGVGNLYEGPRNIPLSYQEALQALEMRTILKKSGIIHIDSIRHNESSQVAVFKKIVDYVYRNFNQKNLSLNQIAKEVHVSHTYICTLFKKYMRVNLSEYLMQTRVEKAKELIRNTDLKTYEVAEKVGYSNAQYFSVLFKKYTGYTPTEFRNS